MDDKKKPTLTEALDALERSIFVFRGLVTALETGNKTLYADRELQSRLLAARQEDIDNLRAELAVARAMPPSDEAHKADHAAAALREALQAREVASAKREADMRALQRRLEVAERAAQENPLPPSYAQRWLLTRQFADDLLCETSPDDPTPTGRVTVLARFIALLDLLGPDQS